IVAGALSLLLLAARRLLRPIMLWAIMLWAMRTLRLLRLALLWLLTVAVAMMMVVHLRSAPARLRLGPLPVRGPLGVRRWGARSVALRAPIGRRDRHPDQLF